MSASASNDRDSQSGSGLAESRLLKLLAAQRWFSGKADSSLSATVLDIVPVTPAGFELAIVSVSGSSTAARTYVVPLLVESLQGAIVECSQQPQFWRELVHRLLSEPRGITTRAGATLSLVEGPGFDRLSSFDDSSSVVIHSGEQSNTSVLLGDDVFLKLFRKVEPGLNPDAEMTSYLSSQAAFRGSPDVMATVELSRDESSWCIALLSERVHAEADAWTTTLRELSEFWSRVAADEQSDISTLLGAFPEHIARLGTTTAELHVALAGSDDTPAFAPEPFTQTQLDQLIANVRGELSETCRLLAVTPLESVETSRLAALVEAAGEAELGRLSELRLTGDEVNVIRCHGDFHLGQVLWTGTEWKIIDFEGEPDRPLQERREKRCALKDVAGMLRSFHYASNAGAVGLIESPSDAIVSADRWRDDWHLAICSSFLGAWREVSSGHDLAPVDDVLFRQLLDLFLLEKVLYELRYELQNRPDWVSIPLIGLANVLQISI